MREEEEEEKGDKKRTGVLTQKRSPHQPAATATSRAKHQQQLL